MNKIFNQNRTPSECNNLLRAFLAIFNKNKLKIEFEQVICECLKVESKIFLLL